jgi:hypothetical protein
MPITLAITIAIAAAIPVPIAIVPGVACMGGAWSIFVGLCRYLRRLYRGAASSAEERAPQFDENPDLRLRL